MAAPAFGLGRDKLQRGEERLRVGLALEAGARHVTTLEYGKIESQHPNVTTLLPAEFQRSWATMEPFDAIVTYSSVEHSGLGRYGDALNPWGDVLEIARAWCVSKPGASLTIGVMYGGDAIEFNRIATTAGAASRTYFPTGTSTGSSRRASCCSGCTC